MWKIQRSQEIVGTFRKLERLRSYDADKEPNNPLLWWKVHAPELPQLARLARRVLCIPATSAPSERIFSVAGQIATQRRNRLTSDTVAMLLYLLNAWPPAEAWRKEHPEELKEGRKPGSQNIFRLRTSPTLHCFCKNLLRQAIVRISCRVSVGGLVDRKAIKITSSVEKPRENRHFRACRQPYRRFLSI